MESKLCMYCGSSFKGRRDKKFCDDQCRNAFNNRLHMPETLMMRQVHQLLKRNRKVLEANLPPNKLRVKLPISQLVEQGFIPNYHTKIALDKQGNITYYCYEYGFQLMDEYMLIFLEAMAKAA